MSDSYVMLNDDYAVLNAGGVCFYFGYECVLGGDGDREDGEWCFEAKDGERTVALYPASMLHDRHGPRPGAEPAEFLLAGIKKMIDEGRLAFTPESKG